MNCECKKAKDVYNDVCGACLLPLAPNPKMTSEKLLWLARYKSKAGKAIARRSWEACETALKAQESPSTEGKDEKK
jgi:hypothetical protein